MSLYFTNRETDVMAVLWEDGPSTVAEVQAKLEDKLAYTTVLTVLRLLESKGYVDHREDGKAHRYFALIDYSEARSSALQRLEQKFFRGSSALLFTHMVAERKLTAEDVRELRKLLDQYEEGDES